MDISGIYTQNLTLTFSSSSLLVPTILGQQPEETPSALPTNVGSSAAPTDTIAVSPEARQAATTAFSTKLDRSVDDAGTPATITPAGGTVSSATASSEAPDRADALFAALDADGDGAITNDEFVDGARALLRRAHRHGHDDVDGPGHYRHHRHHGLTRRLDRLFDRVDANGDGNVDKAELSAALQGVGSSGSNEPAPAATVAAATITVVATTTLSKPSPQTTVVPTVTAKGDPDGTTGTIAPDSAEEGTEPVDEAAEPVKEPVGTSPAGPLLSITQITVVTVAIQQYTTLSYADPSATASTIRASA